MTVRKFGRGVALVGAGMSKFGAMKGKNSRDLFVEAFDEMRLSVDRGFDPRDVGAVYIGNYSSDLFENQGQIAPIMASWVGLTPRPTVRVEAACASGGLALRQGALAIASGMYDIVLVGAVEKMTDLPTEKVTDALGTAADAAFEVSVGFTFPGLYATMATAYLNKHGVSPEVLMKVAIKNHDHGSLNEKAQFGTKVSELMAQRKASAARKGLPVPDWEDEMAFLRDAKPAVV
jgi:acetyl-CoA C-acetyltransferase